MLSSSVFSLGIRVSEGNRDSSLLFCVRPSLENHPMWGVLLGLVISVTEWGSQHNSGVHLAEPLALKPSCIFQVSLCQN